MFRVAALLVCLGSIAPGVGAADSLQHRQTYERAYGAARRAVTVDPAQELPRYPPVEPAEALATWEVKPGFKIEFAAHEPFVRDPIAITFDENGRMFVCEMIDYSERRDVTPHLGRISLLEDRDGDGFFETSRVFADNLPWPTGLIWANGGLFVGATPDIWRFEDRDGDGVAEFRERVFTGFGTGLPRLNVQTLLNSFSWGPDNRVHVQSGAGNRGRVRCLKRPDLPEQEIGARDFWFDPRTLEFGFESGGAQYGMSFDDHGRRYACSNADHLQLFVYDDRYAARNPFFALPAARQSIAADGGAAEVFRISPDEPWRIIRTRWRIGGVMPGPIEGGGRVSGYFTGATGTTVYRGDALGAGFADNTFTGDAGGQLVHRKQLVADGVLLSGRRPGDEQGIEFARSRDTWVRVVNFANAPDGCLYVCDMYREVIEHPWSIPEQIKQHLDLNSGNDRGRIYRIVPTRADWTRRGAVRLGEASTSELVATLEHRNGWHRDTATRLLYERQDSAAVPALRQLLQSSRAPLGRLHALSALHGLAALDDGTLRVALADAAPGVRERAIRMAEDVYRSRRLPEAVAKALAAVAADPEPRVRFQFAFTAGSLLDGQADEAARASLGAAMRRLAREAHADTWISAALLSAPVRVVTEVLLADALSDRVFAAQSGEWWLRLLEIGAAAEAANPAALQPLIDTLVQPGVRDTELRAFGEGLRRAGRTMSEVDTDGKLKALFARAGDVAVMPRQPEAERVAAIKLLAFGELATSREALIACLGPRQPATVQRAAVESLAGFADPQVTAALLRNWTYYVPGARAATLVALLAREERIEALLTAIGRGAVRPTDLTASQVETLASHRNAALATKAREVLASVLPKPRQEVVASFAPAIAQRGDPGRGRAQFVGHCAACHRAGGEGQLLGPDLASVKSRGREGLIEAIVDPNREVAPQYIGYEVETRDGNGYVGIIARDEATTLTLRIMGGAELTLVRTQIKGSTSSGRSLMPEGLEAGMSVQDMADLLTFIEQLP